MSGVPNEGIIDYKTVQKQYYKLIKAAEGNT